MDKLQRPWGDMAYLRRGPVDQGCAMLFLEGTACDIDDWQPTWSHLPADVPLLALDYPGHGESDAPSQTVTLDTFADDAAALLDLLDIREVVLVGHSLGGILAYRVAKRDRRVSGIVSLEGWTYPRAGYSFEEAHHYGHLTDAAIALIAEKYDTLIRRFDAGLWQQVCDDVAKHDDREFLARADMPVMQVYGSAGRTDQTLAGLGLPDNPRSSLHWIDNAGHYLPHEKPAAVAEICMSRWNRQT